MAKYDNSEKTDSTLKESVIDDPNQAIKNQLRAEIEAEYQAKEAEKAEKARIEAEEKAKNQWYEITIGNDYNSHTLPGYKPFKAKEPRFTQDKVLVSECEMNAFFNVRKVEEEEVRAKKPGSLNLKKK